MFEPVAPSTGKRKRATSQTIGLTPQPRHPYLTGNFAPIHQTLPLTPCTYSGTIPKELANGEYVRNGSNPVSNEDLGRDAHWFDGDGMLSGVSFPENPETGEIEPEFVNQYVLTDLYLSAVSSPRLRVPILPSIATLVNPVASTIYVMLRILRTVILVILSFLPGSKQPIKKISVANTHIIYHDGRALATCESGPPMRIQLPGLETVGWYNGAYAENEKSEQGLEEEKARAVEKQVEKEKVLGQDGGVIAFMREWTTAHPKIDPVTGEMMMFHASFAPPYVQYSILPQQGSPTKISEDPEKAELQERNRTKQKKMLNYAVSGVSGAKMMHDFGVSRSHTIIMDLPLSLDPMNQLKGLPPVAYDSSKPSRFGVFPRWNPENVTWFETDACCIFHTANTWDSHSNTGAVSGVNMLACRLTSATMVFAAGNIAPPAERKAQTTSTETQRSKRMPFFSKYDTSSEASLYDRASLLENPDPTPDETEAFLHLGRRQDTLDGDELDDYIWDEEQCRLYYYHFNQQTAQIDHQWALATIPFEFPSVRPDREMHAARYVYGCSTSTTNFGSALGKATKIDVLVKIDARTLIARGMKNPPRSVSGCVDTRTMAQVLASSSSSSSTTSSDDDNDNENDNETHSAANEEDRSIQAFRLPDGWFAQEPRFVPASTSSPTSSSSTSSSTQETPEEDDEDNGYLLFYAFNENAHLDPVTGSCPPDSDPDLRAKSELWILNARDMKTVVARVFLPQRVPYGLHGSWFGADMVRGQRALEDGDGRGGFAPGCGWFEGGDVGEAWEVL
ncbi:carotenoid oxygenase [Hortaea werneckii]|nr:carotenoid oxygenase [Hortaea werneckii]